MTPDLINAIHALKELFPNLNSAKPPVRVEPPNNRPEFLSKQDAARMLGVSVRTIERYILEGKLTKRMVGKRVRVNRWEVEYLVN